MRSDRFFRSLTEDFSDLKKALLNKSTEDWCDKHLSLGKGKPLFALDDMDVDHNPTSGPKTTSDKSGKGKGKGKPKPHPKLVRQSESGQKEFHQKFSTTIFCKYCQKKGHYETDCWVQFPEKRPKFSDKPKFGGGKGHGKGNAPKPQAKQAKNFSRNSAPPQSDFRSDLHDQSKKRARVSLLNNVNLWILKASVNGTVVDALIDSGATISVVAKRFVPDHQLNRELSIPVQVASGQTVYTLGTSDLIVELDSTLFKQKVQVLETSAFDAILGLDFLTQNPRCGGVLTQPPL